MESQSFSRKELFELVWSEPLSSLARKYKISDVGLRKICIRMDVPLPRAGYWLTKMDQHNMPIVKPALSKKYSGQNTVRLEIRSEASRGNMGKPSVKKLIQQEIEQKIVQMDLVTGELTDPDPLVQKTKSALRQSSVDHYSYIGTLHCGSKEGLDTRVAKTNVFRALCFWNAFSKALKVRGHNLFLKDTGTFIKIGTSDYKVWLREKCIKAIDKDGKWDNGVYHPNGMFSLSASRSWNDGTEKLENMIPKIIADIEVRYKEFKEREERREKKWAEEKEQARIRAEVL